MANEHSGSRKRTRRASAATRRDDLADWRRLTRPVIVENFLNHTRDLRWSRELIDLLLEELHVSDEFDDLIGRVPPSAQVSYPQLVALAVVLRHSWYPEDLTRIIADVGLPPSASPPVDRVSTSELVDRANRGGRVDQAAPSPHTCTPQKGEQRTC